MSLKFDRRAIEPLTLSLFFLILLFFYICFSFQRIPFPDDVFWHTQLGLDFFQKGFDAFIDQASITHFNEKIRTSALGFEIVVGLWVKLFGEPGIQITRMCFWIALFFACRWSFRKLSFSNQIQFFGLTLILFAIASRFTIRPEVTGYPFLILIAHFYFLHNLLPNGQFVDHSVPSRDESEVFGKTERNGLLWMCLFSLPLVFLSYKLPSRPAFFGDALFAMAVSIYAKTL